MVKINFMKKWMIAVFVLCACGTPVAQSALEVLAPIAADTLTQLIDDRYGKEVDEGSAGCFALPAGFNDDEFEYAICRAKAVE